MAVRQLGPEARPALASYLERALADPYLGAQEFTAAALERLDAPVPPDLVTDAWREHLNGMLDVSHALARAHAGPPP